MPGTGLAAKSVPDTGLAANPVPRAGLVAYFASVSGRMDVIYVRILLPYAERFDPGRMTYVQSLSVTSA